MGKPGETYNIGGCNEKTNLDVVTDHLRPAGRTSPRFTGDAASQRLISFVKDRPGHDRRYAINAGKILSELGWQPAESFATGIRKTVIWYLENQHWVEQVVSGEYRRWLDIHYTANR